MQYLVEWAFQLCGRSGSGLEGPAPLSYGTIEAWSRLTETHVEPHEVDALIALDHAIRNPEEPKDEAEPPREEDAAWPTKKKPNTG